jgi:hypothetical protein
VLLDFADHISESHRLVQIAQAAEADILEKRLAIPIKKIIINILWRLIIKDRKINLIKLKDSQSAKNILASIED